MMVPGKTLVLLLTALALPGARPVAAQTDVTELLPLLRSHDVKERVSAASRVLASPGAMSNNAVRLALVDLLELENALVVSSYQRGIGASTEFGEGYSEYYSVLFNAVLRGGDLQDVRTLRALAQGAYNPDSKAVEIIADAGGQRIIPIAEELLKTDVVGKRSALALLAHVYEKKEVHRLSAAEARVIKDAIVRAAGSEETLRLSIELLGRIGTREDLPLLRRIAASDPTNRIHDRLGVIYPNSELAKEAIEKILRRSPQ